LKRHEASTRSHLFYLVHFKFYGSRDFIPESERVRAQREKSLQSVKEDSMNPLLGLAIDRAKNPASALNDRWNSDEEDIGDEGDVNIIDRCKSAL
jgi:GPN-loop GTPase